MTKIHAVILSKVLKHNIIWTKKKDILICGAKGKKKFAKKIPEPCKFTPFHKDMDQYIAPYKEIF